MSVITAPEKRGKPLPRLHWKRFGIAGFLFFFVKGLLWLAIPALLYQVQ